MTTRRDFIRKSSLALLGGLLVGDEALELFERLAHKKVWAGFSGTSSWDTFHSTYSDDLWLLSADTRYVSNALGNVTHYDGRSLVINIDGRAFTATLPLHPL